LFTFILILDELHHERKYRVEKEVEEAEENSLEPSNEVFVSVDAYYSKSTQETLTQSRAEQMCVAVGSQPIAAHSGRPKKRRDVYVRSVHDASNQL